MQLTNEDIKEFQSLCKLKLGVELNDVDAASGYRALITLARFVLGLA